MNDKILINILRTILTLAIILCSLTFILIIFTNVDKDTYRIILMILSLIVVYYLARKYNFRYVKIFSIISMFFGIISMI